MSSIEAHKLYEKSGSFRLVQHFSTCGWRLSGSHIPLYGGRIAQKLLNGNVEKQHFIYIKNYI